MKEKAQQQKKNTFSVKKANKKWAIKNGCGKKELA